LLNIKIIAFPLLAEVVKAVELERYISVVLRLLLGNQGSGVVSSEIKAEDKHNRDISFKFNSFDNFR
jgi:hypothetical protein